MTAGRDNPTTRFEYAPDIVARFPSVVGGVIHATGLTNGASPAELVEAFQEEEVAVLGRIGSTVKVHIERIMDSGWHRGDGRASGTRRSGRLRISPR